jgi:hypothetical protein
LFALDNERFLLTVGHVADLSEGAQLYIAAENHPLLVEGTKTVTKTAPGGNRRQDRIDLAVIHLGPTTIRYLRDADFLSRADLAPDGDPLHDEFFLVAGYPCSKQRFRPKRSAIEAYLYPFMAVSRTPEFYVSKGLNPKDSLLLGFRKQDMWRRDAGRITAPDLHGMSGCGVWWVEGYTSFEMVQPRLAAIAIEWHKGKQGFILSTRVDVALGGIWATDPKFRNLLDN